MSTLPLKQKQHKAYNLKEPGGTQMPNGLPLTDDMPNAQSDFNPMNQNA